MKKCLHVFKIAAAVILTGVISTQVYAGSIEDIEQQRDQAEENKSGAENILSQLESKKNDLQVWVAELDKELEGIQTEIGELNQQKADLEVQIADKQQELAAAKEEEAQQYADMCARIQFMYENNNTSYMDALLTAGSMSDILNRSEYVSAMANYDYNMLEGLVQTREQIANDEQLLQIDLNAVEELTAQAKQKEETVNDLIDKKSAEISEYESQIDRQEKLIAQYDAEMQAAASRIAELEAQAAGSGNFIPFTGGGLVWPCPSSNRITSYFGYRTPDGGYVNANHKGLDIGAPTGTPAVAAASGVVVIARYSNSAGNWVVISHGNGFYTIYMHASQLCVTEGQYVNAGDTILLVGSTGWSTGPHLHFGVGVGGYTSAFNVDPLSYYQ